MENLQKNQKLCPESRLHGETIGDIFGDVRELDDMALATHKNIAGAVLLTGDFYFGLDGKETKQILETYRFIDNKDLELRMAVMLLMQGKREEFERISSPHEANIAGTA